MRVKIRDSCQKRTSFPLRSQNRTDLSLVFNYGFISNFGAPVPLSQLRDNHAALL